MRRDIGPFMYFAFVASLFASPFVDIYLTNRSFEASKEAEKAYNVTFSGCENHPITEGIGYSESDFTGIINASTNSGLVTLYLNKTPNLKVFSSSSDDNIRTAMYIKKQEQFCANREWDIRMLNSYINSGQAMSGAVIKEALRIAADAKDKCELSNKSIMDLKSKCEKIADGGLYKGSGNDIITRDLLDTCKALGYSFEELRQAIGILDTKIIPLYSSDQSLPSQKLTNLGFLAHSNASFSPTLDSGYLLDGNKTITDFKFSFAVGVQTPSGNAKAILAKTNSKIVIIKMFGGNLDMYGQSKELVGNPVVSANGHVLYSALSGGSNQLYFDAKRYEKDFGNLLYYDFFPNSSDFFVFAINTTGDYQLMTCKGQ